MSFLLVLYAAVGLLVAQSLQNQNLGQALHLAIPAAICALFVVPGLAKSGYLLLNLKSTRIDANGIEWTDARGDCDHMSWELARSIRPGSAWRIVALDGREIYLPLKPQIRTVLRVARAHHFPDKVERESRKNKRALLRCGVYIVLLCVAGTVLMHWLLPNAPTGIRMMPLVLLVPLGVSGIQLGLAYLWRRHRVAYERSRTQAANRQNSTAPLPSPTTPDDPLT